MNHFEGNENEVSTGVNYKWMEISTRQQLWPSA